MTDAGPGTVLFVEDDAALRDATVQGLELAGLAVRAFGDAEAALAAIKPDLDGVVLSDIRLPRMDGLELLAELRRRDPDLPVVLVTGHGDVPMAVSALQQGAFDFITKPFAIDHLAATVARALDRRALVTENRRLRAAIAAEPSPLLGESGAMQRVRAHIADLAATDLDVLIEGETGTGKDLAAAMVHRGSRRRARAFVTVDCAALPADGAAVELFGHAADTVPHTRAARDGLIARSSGGTLLLDGVDALAPDVQAALLRTLEEREVQPIGAERPQPLDLRVVATSRVSLWDAVPAGAFRPDLFHRLALTRLMLPPLRAREHDRLLLFASFAGEAAARLGRGEPVLSDAARAHLLAHDWPGNVRELRNFAYQSVLGLCEHRPAATAADLRSRVADFEADLLRETLRSTRGNVSRAVALLQLPRKTFYEKLTRYGISPAIFRDGGEPECAASP